MVCINKYKFRQFKSKSIKKSKKLSSDDAAGFQDFVKISKWNDVSFWSIKQSVEKTHR